MMNVNNWIDFDWMAFRTPQAGYSNGNDSSFREIFDCFHPDISRLSEPNKNQRPKKVADMACEITFKDRWVRLNNRQFANLINFVIEVAEASAQESERPFVERLKRMRDKCFWPGRGIDIDEDFPDLRERNFGPQCSTTLRVPSSTEKLEFTITVSGKPKRFTKPTPQDSSSNTQFANRNQGGPPRQ